MLKINTGEKRPKAFSGDNKKKLKGMLLVALSAGLLLSGCQNKTPAPSETPTPTPVVLQTPAPSKETVNMPSPFVYEKEGEVFLLCGASSVSLGKTVTLYNYKQFMNSALTGDNAFLFYIAYNGKENNGDLMRIRTDCKTPPEKIAEGVCAASISNDGSSILYITDITDMSGTLYLKAGDSAPKEIAQGVLPVYFGFSPGKNWIYYTGQLKQGTALYVKNGYADAIEAARFDITPGIGRGINLDLGNITVGDGGQVLYTVHNRSTGDDAIYLFSPDGNTQTITEHGALIRTLGSADEFLYTDKESQSLLYKAPGKEAQAIAQGYYSAIFAGQDQLSDGDTAAEGSAGDKQFLILDQNAANNLEALYFQQAGSDKVKITEDENIGSVQLGPGRDCAVYQKSDGTYISAKTGTGWTEEKLSDILINDAIVFDGSGKNLYYIEPGSEDGTGPLWKVSVETGEKQKLMDSASDISIAGDTPFAFTEDGWLYRVSGNTPVQIVQNYTNIQETSEGVYISDDLGSLMYLLNGSDVAVPLKSGGYVDKIGGTLAYYPSLDKDSGAALDTLANDTYYYLSLLDPTQPQVNAPPSRTISEDVDLCARLSLSANNGTLKEAFSLFSKGFADYKSYDQSKDASLSETAVESLQSAIDFYQSHYSS